MLGGIGGKRRRGRQRMRWLDGITRFVKELEAHFIGTEDFVANYLIIIDGVKKPLFIGVDRDNIDIHYGKEDQIDVVAKLDVNVMQEIVDGRMSFQRAFMTGEMTAKGNFKTLRMLDQLFPF